MAMPRKSAQEATIVVRMNWITPYIENAAILHYYLYAGKGFLPSLAPKF